MYQFTEAELAFWQELTAPFADDCYRWREGPGGAKLTYLRSRTLMNRLDDVVGPPHWTDTYVATDKGVVCELTIIFPKGKDQFGSITRAGLGGWADLGGDINSEFKSAGTSAFVIACSKLGIGRDLYGEGMPDYWARKFGGLASGYPMQQLPGGAPSPENCKQEPAPAVAAAGNGRASTPATGGGYGDSPPLGKPGKPVYAWAKKMEEKFSIDVVGKMGSFAKKQGKSAYTNDWDIEFSDQVVSMVVEWIKTLANYGGEFGPAVPVTNQAAATETGYGDLVPRKKAIVAAVTACLQKKFDRDPSQGEVIAEIGKLGADVPNGSGHRGEVLESLKSCSDDKWLTGILKAAQNALAEAARLAASAAPEDDDIPF